MTLLVLYLSAIGGVVIGLVCAHAHVASKHKRGSLSRGEASVVTYVQFAIVGFLFFPWAIIVLSREARLVITIAIIAFLMVNRDGLVQYLHKRSDVAD